MPGPVNPDPRPLPAGWNQHYDARDDIWYYVCTNVRPPSVSTTHPLGPIPIPPPPPSAARYSVEMNVRPVSSNSVASPALAEYVLNPGIPEPRIPHRRDSSAYRPLPSPQLVNPPVHQPDPHVHRRSATNPALNDIQPQSSGLSFAQELYRSSIRPLHVQTSSAYSSLVPPDSSASSGTMPTPPVSPNPYTTRPTQAVLPPPPPPTFTTSASLHENVPDLYSNIIPQRSRPHRASSSAQSPPSLGPPSVLNHHHTPPHRSQSYQPTTPVHSPPFIDNHNPHRASTMLTKPREIPKLTTTARPPSQAATLSAKPLTTPALQKLSPPPPPPKPVHPAVALAAPVPLRPTLPNSPAGGPIAASYPSPPNTSQVPVPPVPISPPQLVPQVQAQVPVQVVQQTQAPNQQPGNQNAGIDLTKLGSSIGSFAMNIAGGAVKASLGLDPTGIAGTIGGALVNGTDVVSSLTDGISGMVLGGNGGGNAGSGVDYSNVINALTPQQPAVGYQTPQVQLVQNGQDPTVQLQLAMAQQSAIYQQQVQQAAMAAVSQQQQQAAIAQQHQAAAAQQQQAIMTAIAQQQQQAQQQAQQQIQLQLQIQQQQNPSPPQLSPLGLLTGFGNALSNLGENGDAQGAGVQDTMGGAFTYLTDMLGQETQVETT